MVKIGQIKNYPLKQTLRKCKKLHHSISHNSVSYRKSSSEYDKEREELKDSVLRWKERYEKRKNEEAI